MPDALDLLADEIAARSAPKIAAKLLEVLPAQANPLFTVKQAAAHTGLSQTTIRDLVKAGALKKAAGLKDTRIRRSVLDAYGK